MKEIFFKHYSRSVIAESVQLLLDSSRVLGHCNCVCTVPCVPTVTTGQMPPPHLGQLICASSEGPPPTAPLSDPHPHRAPLLGCTPQLSLPGSGLTCGPRWSAPADRDSSPAPKPQQACSGRENETWSFCHSLACPPAAGHTEPFPRG